MPGWCFPQGYPQELWRDPGGEAGARPSSPSPEVRADRFLDVLSQVLDEGALARVISESCRTPPDYPKTLVDQRLAQANARLSAYLRFLKSSSEASRASASFSQAGRRPQPAHVFPCPSLYGACRPRRSRFCADPVVMCLGERPDPSASKMSCGCRPYLRTASRIKGRIASASSACASACSRRCFSWATVFGGHPSILVE